MIWFNRKGHNRGAKVTKKGIQFTGHGSLSEPGFSGVRDCHDFMKNRIFWEKSGFFNHAAYQ